MSWRKGERPNWKRWQVVRLKALDRDNWQCVKCGKLAREVDHIIPLDRPGADMYALGGLQSLCKKCHISKTRLENTTHRPEVAAWRTLLADRLAST